MSVVSVYLPAPDRTWCARLSVVTEGATTPWSWASLPGLKYEPPYPFWKSGMFSIRGETAAMVAAGHRLGVSPVMWLMAPHIWGDRLKAARLRAAGKNLCGRCEGTGNQLESMYQRCSACGGTGAL